ncbi:right-handed parallel beta-helix repeat-containing protein [Mucilaginibacter robiniae]|uniref:Right-handed parallel beta-helix repeat-containing protein n=1 Tax=Mucilaginibacter robiniae TaxID=2728022 RepID=A0A7L5DYS7_9SPHI|nr:right-handed parallel beta-helix repeat-containing protein [Mucilaginibacter robiniae]QJD94404.1 right-handed parallel beta-helix repeat-containing protein [Mucilaginibacter robiniae]
MNVCLVVMWKRLRSALLVSLFFMALQPAYAAIASNGVDDTDALQAQLDKGKDLVLTGTLIINRTLIVPSGVNITGGTLVNGNNMSGYLLANGTFLKFQNVSNSVIKNVTFKATNGFHLTGWLDAVVLIKDAVNITVSNCTFNLNQPYGKAGMEAVWITGPQSSKNNILSNKLKTCGIVYAENGASGTLVKGNSIINAHQNALTGTGNNAACASKDVSLIQNTIINAGRMGIEDFRYMDGTTIAANKIKGTGKSIKERVDGMGISCVGYNSKVTGNIIEDAQTYCIESGGNHHILIADNTIIDNELTATGIMSNVTSPPPSSHISNNSITRNNTIKGTYVAIAVFGNNPLNLSIERNNIQNPSSKGIDITSTAVNYQITVSGNHFIFSKAGKDKRTALSTYAATPQVNQLLTVANNILSYNDEIGMSKNTEYGFFITTNYVTFTHNIVSYHKQKVYPFFTNGVKLVGLKAIDNTANGVKL